MEAIDKNLYGWFWTCPNGEKCIYRHALPPGFVLKRKETAKVEQDDISLEELIEKEVISLTLIFNWYFNVYIYLLFPCYFLLLFLMIAFRSLTVFLFLVSELAKHFLNLKLLCAVCITVRSDRKSFKNDHFVSCQCI